MGYDGADGEEMMCIDIEMWQWLYLPLFLVGLCLCLHFGCFTKRNLLAWLVTLVINPLVLCLLLQFYPKISTGGAYLLRSAISVVLMLAYCLGIKKHTPFNETLSLVLFAATAFAIVDVVLGMILYMLGFLY